MSTTIEFFSIIKCATKTSKPWIGNQILIDIFYQNNTKANLMICLQIYKYKKLLGELLYVYIILESTDTTWKKDGFQHKY